MTPLQLTSMKRLRQVSRLVWLVTAPALMIGQIGLEPTDILKPLAEQWTTYNGDYSARRYSLLKQIDQSNVRNLSLAWVTRFIAGSGPTGSIPAPTGRGAPVPYPGRCWRIRNRRVQYRGQPPPWRRHSHG